MVICETRREFLAQQHDSRACKNAVRRRVRQLYSNDPTKKGKKIKLCDGAVSQLALKGAEEKHVKRAFRKPLCDLVPEKMTVCVYPQSSHAQKRSFVRLTHVKLDDIDDFEDQKLALQSVAAAAIESLVAANKA